MNGSWKRRGITTDFNIVVFLIVAVWGVLKFLFISGKAQGYSADALILSTGVDVVRCLIMLFLLAWVLKEFWNRLIADVFSLRDLEYRETIAVVLVASLPWGS